MTAPETPRAPAQAGAVAGVHAQAQRFAIRDSEGGLTISWADISVTDEPQAAMICTIRDSDFAKAMGFRPCPEDVLAFAEALANAARARIEQANRDATPLIEAAREALAKEEPLP